MVEPTRERIDMFMLVISSFSGACMGRYMELLFNASNIKLLDLVLFAISVVLLWQLVLWLHKVGRYCKETNKTVNVDSGKLNTIKDVRVRIMDLIKEYIVHRIRRLEYDAGKLPRQLKQDNNLRRIHPAQKQVKGRIKKLKRLVKIINMIENNGELAVRAMINQEKDVPGL